eukprot:CAMPEP_0206480526 /NCGR_PEP_ID=MMETSP0324_2-20121206/37413_1 /ASSEMBLY_ACC=CAM_ASM_000836 /TAXON_ID=2866 /ORGANISM="Crypthecodinium cohnii, Strain Seligo" /LENGTH=260 /DNA_ID=CAMNT_0053957463 /DNA_START=465 /DNA_END=1248 /DNA_ORIENTATION=-
MALSPLVALMIVALEISDWKAWVFSNPRFVVILVAPIFAIQANVALQGGLGTVTMMVTGHFHSLTSAALGYFFGDPMPNRARTIWTSISVLSGLCVGAMIGTRACFVEEAGRTLQDPENLHLLLLPVAPLLAAVLVCYDVVFFDCVGCPIPFYKKAGIPASSASDEEALEGGIIDGDGEEEGEEEAVELEEPLEDDLAIRCSGMADALDIHDRQRSRRTLIIQPPEAHRVVQSSDEGGRLQLLTGENAQIPPSAPMQCIA